MPSEPTWMDIQCERERETRLLSVSEMLGPLVLRHHCSSPSWYGITVHVGGTSRVVQGTPAQSSPAHIHYLRCKIFFF